MHVFYVDVLEDDEFELPRSYQTRLQSFSMVLQPWFGFRVRLQEVYKDLVIVVMGEKSCQQDIFTVSQVSARFLYDFEVAIVQQAHFPEGA